MSSKKVAISVPGEVIDQIDRLAKMSKNTRSRYITIILKKVAVSARESEITKKINELFSDPSVIEEQKKTADYYLLAKSGDGGKW